MWVELKPSYAYVPLRTAQWKLCICLCLRSIRYRRITLSNYHLCRQQPRGVSTTLPAHPQVNITCITMFVRQVGKKRSESKNRIWAARPERASPSCEKAPKPTARRCRQGRLRRTLATSASDARVRPRARAQSAPGARWRNPFELRS